MGIYCQGNSVNYGLQEYVFKIAAISANIQLAETIKVFRKSCLLSDLISNERAKILIGLKCRMEEIFFRVAKPTSIA
jgi:hypothetical protein